jgi:uncharacterized protein
MAAREKKFVNISKARCLADRARVADNFVSRMIGLLSSAPLVPGQGLLIVPCNCIHMFGMKFPIDAVFFDKEWTVVGLVESIVPGKMSPMFSKAKCCLELPAGAIAESGTAVGDRFEVSEVAGQVLGCGLEK